jgi:SAM-dependent methyltransferase
MLSKVLNGVLRTALTLEPRDLSSGFRLYRKRVLRGLDIEFLNFAVLIEILLKTFARGAIITETPFHYQPRIEGVSHARIIAFGMDYLRLIRRMWGIRNSIDFPDYDWRAHNGRIWFQRYWQRRRHGIIMRFAPPSGLVCDIGCGSSHILADLPHAVGMDLRLEKLRFMRPRHRGALMQGDGMALPFADGSLDGVISSEIIEHIPEEHGRHIDELLRVLKPGGIVVLGTPDYGGWQWPLIEWLYRHAAPGAYADEHVTHYTRASLRKALTDRGCEILAEDAICKAELVVKAKKPGA